MAYYLVKHAGKTYATHYVYQDIVAGGQKRMTDLLAKGRVKTASILGVLLFELTKDQEAECRNLPFVIDQDIDVQLQTVKSTPGTGNGTVIKMGAVKPEYFTLKTGHTTYTFFEVRAFKDRAKYHMLPRLPVVKVGSKKFIAVNAVNTVAVSPVVVSDDSVAV
jgi:hypothetical protein